MDCVKPYPYDLKIKNDMEKRLFEGWVKIFLKVIKETDSLVFHAAKNLKITSASVAYTDKKGDNKDVSVKTSSLGDDHRAEIKLPHIMRAGSKAKLLIRYNSALETGMTGYYLGKAKGGLYAVIYFQPTFARMAFPCWDEIDMKATFDIRMVSRENTKNISNMDFRKEGPTEPPEDGWKMTTFNRTHKMSTYFVAFANGHFEKTGAIPCKLKGNRTVPLQIWGMPEHIKDAEHALRVKASVLPLYEEMFQLTYPLPKLDTLIVDDLDTGAMENWGLITGHGAHFCIDASSSSNVLTKREVTIFMSHEVSHMWFGDITTPKSWDYLYLNEGFATLIGEVLAIERLRRVRSKLIDDKWNARTAFIFDHLEVALSTDAKASSHAIEEHCRDADEAQQRFDDLSYKKGAAVLMMLMDFVGESAFLKGVSKYLERHREANAGSSDLWKAIGDVSGKKVCELMGFLT